MAIIPESIIETVHVQITPNIHEYQLIDEEFGNILINTKDKYNEHYKEAVVVALTVAAGFTFIPNEVRRLAELAADIDVMNGNQVVYTIRGHTLALRYFFSTLKLDGSLKFFVPFQPHDNSNIKKLTDFLPSKYILNGFVEAIKKTFL